jgi:hypothetical protein
VPVLEPGYVVPDGAQRPVRPVVKVYHEGNTIALTRVDPLDRSSSVLLRLRPGWKDLLGYLSGEADAHKRQNGVKKR